jgi:vancomycin resistance protein YoaR
MGTSTSVERPAAPSRTSPARRVGLLVVGALAALVLLFFLLLIGLRTARAGVLPGTVVGGVEVGGQSEEELRSSLEDLERERAAEPVIARRPPQEGDPRGEATIEASAAQVGYDLDVEATVAEVLARGRQANPFAALADHLRAFTTPTTVDPVERVDRGTLNEWVEDIAADLELPPQEGAVRFEGAQVVRVEPVPGLRIDAERLRAAAERAALEPGAEQIEIATEPQPATASQADVDEVYAQAQRVVSAPVTLTHGEDSVTISPEDLTSVLRIEPGPDGAGLEIVPDAQALADLLGDPAPLDTPPVDATVVLQAGAPTIVEGEPGFRYDVEAAAVQVRDLALSEGPRTGEVEGEEALPERTAEEARALGITQQVSTFTTPHPCCANRVQNIHRMADLVRGVIIEPGETFSLNSFVGERTTAKGFLPDAAIQDGEYVQSVGGGVSQFATTMFNAAYFAGIDIVEHKPHSQYISRYPEGREATLSYPSVDLKVRNNSPHGILVDTSYTGTSITVSFWSSPWVRVDSVTSPRSNFTPPETIVRPNPELAPGQEVVIQEAAGQGFTVTVTRTLTFPDGRTESEDFTTTYVARPRIVERGV